MTLAVLPFILVGIFGIIKDPLFPQDTNLTRAEDMAARIALVADQIENSSSPEASEVVLDATRNTGLDVQSASPFSEESGSTSSFQDRMLHSLSNIHGRSAWMVAHNGADPLIVVELRGSLLAFVPAVLPPPNEANDYDVNIVLSVIIIALPVALLSIYAARMVTYPLTRIASAAQAQCAPAPMAACSMKPAHGKFGSLRASSTK